VGAVLVQAVKVQLPRLLGTLAADLVRSLATLKLGDQLTHERIRLPHELAVAFDVERLRLRLKLLQHPVGADDRLRQVLDLRDGDGRGEHGGTVLVVDATGQIGVHEGILQDIPFAVLLAFHHLLLHLLLHRVHRRVIVQDLGEGEHIVKGFALGHRVHDDLLVRVELDREEAGNAPLEVDVDAVHQRGFGQVHLVQTEQVAVVDLLVAEEEVPTSAGELVLHLLLDANVLDDVGDPLEQLDHVALRFGSIEQLLAPLVGGPQGVADLVGDQHGLHRLRHLPHGHDEVAVLDVKRCGFRLLIEREGEVFGGESAGKDGERSVHGVSITDARWESIGWNAKWQFFFASDNPSEASRLLSGRQANNSKFSKIAGAIFDSS